MSAPSFSPDTPPRRPAKRDRSSVQPRPNGEASAIVSRAVDNPALRFSSGFGVGGFTALDADAGGSTSTGTPFRHRDPALERALQLSTFEVSRFAALLVDRCKHASVTVDVHWL
jgi:hypothetical protein